MKKLIPIFIITLFITCLLSSIDTTLASAYEEYNGHYYVRVTGSTWLDARNDAKTTHGLHWDLVTINDQNENDWLESTFSPGFFSDAPWIGYYDATGTGWQWADGTVSGYENWGLLQPWQKSQYASMNGHGHWISSYSIAPVSTWGIAEAVAPEPLSAVLFLMGGAGLVIVRRRKRRRG